MLGSIVIPQHFNRSKNESNIYNFKFDHRILYGLSQDRSFFNLIPDIGAVKGQCVFGSIECDSQYIYIVGDEVVSQDSNGRNKKVKPYFTKFDYQGNLIHSVVVGENDFSRPYKY
ncbi:MAG: hypothetical protein IPO72_08980, partial [Saprospiraceae bacterium]|nr:hypothetical protein [Candidatus Vicinibacter affinis]